MTFKWESLKFGHKTHNLHVVWSQIYNIRKDSYHGYVFNLIYQWCLIFFAQFASCSHGFSHWLAIFHPKLIQSFFEIFGLGYKHSLWRLSNLQAQEEGKLSNHGHFELFFHTFCELMPQLFHVNAKYDIIHIHYYCNRPPPTYTQLIGQPG